MRVRTGDHGEYDDFYDHYQPFVAAYVTRRVTGNAVADLVSEVFTVAWRRRDVVPDDALPWLYRTARNLIGNQYRAQERLAALKDKLLSVPAESAGDPADATASRQQLFHAFADLSDDDREILLLVAWEGLTTSEIADVLGLSPGATSVRLHRARERFDRALGFDGDQPDRGLDITAREEEQKGQQP